MSKIGKMPIKIPAEVKIEIRDKQVTVNGPKGSLSIFLNPGVNAVIDNDKILVSINKKDKKTRSMYGLSRTLIDNMVIGVVQGFEKRLEIIGTGFRVSQQANGLQFSLGKSHQINFTGPEDVVLKVEDQRKILVTGIDKQKVGQVAANIRSLYPPEPYKGKGIRYENEIVRKKAGKQTKAAE